MPTLRLTPYIEDRLIAVAKRTGRSMNALAEEAILKHISDLERLDDRSDDLLAEAKRQSSLARMDALESETLDAWAVVTDRSGWR